MKNHFSLYRFGLLFRKHTTEHFRTYLMSLGVLIGSLFLAMGWIAYISSSPQRTEQQMVFFSFFLMGAGTIFTSTVFSNLSGKSRAIVTLMLPASQLEKYLVGWVYSFLIFLPVFTATFYIVETVILSLDTQPGEILNLFEDKKFAPAMLLIYGILHGIAIWGAVAFEKLSFIKTAISFFILLMLVVVINNYSLEWLFGRELGNTVPFSQVGFQDKENYYMIRLVEDQNKLFSLFPIAMAGLLWLAALLRLKEKQI
jgi:hypothetical protein